MDEGKWNVRCPGVGCTYLLIDADITGALAESGSLEDVLARRSKLRIDNGGSRLEEVLTLALSDASQAGVLQQCQACPQCLVLISRADGCMHMGCLCGCQFCYRCGGSMDLCNCDFDDEIDDFDGGIGGQPCLGLWLLHHQPERLGNACAGLSCHWDGIGITDSMKKRREERFRRQRRQQEAWERQQEAWERLQQWWSRVRMAEQEEREERWRRHERSALGDLLWVAGAPVPAPQEVRDPGQRYEHRFALWDYLWDGHVDPSYFLDYWDIWDEDDYWNYWHFINIWDEDYYYYWHFSNWNGDGHDLTDFDFDFDADFHSDLDELAQRSRRRDRHGAPKRTQTVKAWAPRHPDGASEVEHSGVSNQRATPHRQKVSAPSHPRRQRNATPANALAQQRQEIALARRLREMQRSRQRQSTAMRRASEVIT